MHHYLEIKLSETLNLEDVIKLINDRKIKMGQKVKKKEKS